MTLKEQVQFEKEKLEKKVLSVNDARRLSQLLKVGVAEIAKKAVGDANANSSFDQKLEFLFNALQDIVDFVGKKEISIDEELKGYESQLKLIELLLEQENVDDTVPETEEKL